MPSQIQNDVDKTPDDLPEWQIEGNELVRTAEFGSFQALLDAVVRVEAVAEQANHHPDLVIRWRPPIRTPDQDPKVKLPAVLSLTFRCYTHTRGAVAPEDVALARAIEGTLGVQAG